VPGPDYLRHLQSRWRKHRLSCFPPPARWKNASRASTRARTT
jgi:hypothetical protein